MFDRRTDQSQVSPAPFYDEELLRPTLGESDDAAGFDQPWNPWSLVMLTFFFGVTTGLGLVAFNFGRLGIRGRLYSTLAIAFVFEVLLTAVRMWAIHQGMIDPNNRDDARSLRLVNRIIAVAAALILIQSQRKRFDLFQRSDLPAGHLLRPALLAIAAGVAVDVLKTSVLLPYFVGSQ